MSTPVTPPTMLRARISEEEHRDIRKEAIDAKVSAVDYFATLIRKGRECLAAEREASK